MIQNTHTIRHTTWLTTKNTPKNCRKHRKINHPISKKHLISTSSQQTHDRRSHQKRILTQTIESKRHKPTCSNTNKISSHLISSDRYTRAVTEGSHKRTPTAYLKKPFHSTHEPKLSKNTNPQTQLTGMHKNPLVYTCQLMCGTALTTPPTPNIYIQLFERNHLRTSSVGDHVWCPSKGRVAWRGDYHQSINMERKSKS